MIVPEELYQIISSFYLGSAEECSTMEEWVAGAVRRNEEDELAIAEQFIERLLATHPSAQVLQKIWMGAGPSYFMSDEGLQILFPLLLAALKARRIKETSDASGGSP